MMKIFIWIVSIILGLVVMALCLLHLMPSYHMYIVLSDSMKPAFAAGDLIVTAPASSVIKDGSIVAFQQDGHIITHRVVAITADGVITRGDNNDVSDAPALTSQIQGIYLLKIPHVGYASAFIHTRTGWFLVVILPAALLLGWIIKDIFREALQST